MKGTPRHEIDQGTVSVLPDVLPRRLRRGIREALDAGRGKLRMDPQELANRIGAAIDLELERLARIRDEREHARRQREMFRQAECYFGANGQRGILRATPSMERGQGSGAGDQSGERPCD